MTDPRIKTLKIKTGIVKRLTKEKLTYVKEAEQEEKKVEKYKAEGKDEYVIKKQIEVWQETVQMVPNCQRRLQAAYEDLSNILKTEEDLAENEDYLTAKTILEEAKPHLTSQ